MNAHAIPGAPLDPSPANFVDHLRDLARVRGEAIWLTVASARDGQAVEKHVSYAAFERRARALAAVLQRRFTPGDRALVMMDNDDHYAVSMLGCFFSGVVAVPVFPPESMRPQHLARLSGIAADAEAACVLTTAALGSAMRLEDGPFGAMAVVAVDEVDEAASAEWVEHRPRGEDVAFLQYTSGSTSAPKGVMVTHSNLMANERLIRDKMGIGPEDRFVSWSPLYHDMGLIGGLLQPLFSGLPLVLCSPGHFLERPVRWLELIARHRATVSGGPDFAYRLCVERVKEAHVAQLDLSCWRVAFTGAEPIRARTEMDFCRRFAGAGFDPASVYACYGLAEATLIVTGGRREGGLFATRFSPDALARGRGEAHDAGGLLVGCGTPGADHDVDVIDRETGQACAPGVVGEIHASGPSIAAGYWRRPEATSETFVERGGRRWLRTGDLGFVFDGQLYVSGRSKDLIIVRGHNCYPQDIEQLIETQVEAVRAGRVAAFSVEGPMGEGIGVAAEISRGMQKLVTPDALVEALSAAVGETVGEPLSVVLLLNPGALPRTSSGKLQRQACRQGWADRSLDAYAMWERGAFVGAAPPATGAAPATQPGVHLEDVEATLAGLWRDALRLDDAADIGAASHFFLMGGNSLSASHLAAGIASRWGIAFPAGRVFDLPRLGEGAREVRQRIAERGADRPAPSGPHALPPVPRSGPLPLSPAQQRQWFLWRLDPTSTAYHIATTLALSGHLDVHAFRRAFDDVMARHEVLRTVYPAGPDGTPSQQILPSAGVVLGVADLTGHPDPDAGIDAAMRSLDNPPFDLAAGPLLRAVLLRLSEREHRLVLVMHHIASDSVSMQVLVDDLAVAHGHATDPTRTSALPPLERQYADLAAWQADRLAQGECARQLVYWTQQLGNDHPVLTLPADRPRAAVARYRARRHTVVLPPALVDALRRTAAARGATLFMALLAGLQAVLHRLTGQRDVRLGVPFANRHHAGAAGVMGLFVNTVVLRGVLAGRMSLGDVLAAARDATLGAQENQDLPFDQLVEALQPERSLAHPPLFQVLFNHTHEDLRRFESLTGLSARVHAPDGRAAQFELSVEVREQARGAVTVDLLYAEELFDADTVARWGEHYLNMLGALADDPGRAVGDVEMLSAIERDRLAGWATGEQGHGVEDRVHAMFERQARRTPKAIALRFADETLAYEALEARSNRLAHHLLTLGVQREDRVGVAMHRGIDMVVALLGIMKAGGAYVPLDPDHPAERIDYMVRDSRIALLLTSSALASRLPAGPALIALDTLDLAALPATVPEVALHGDNLVYVIYTSGSTGRPKGAGNRHRSLCNRLAWGQRHQPLVAGDVVLQKTPFSFDISFWEFFWPLSVGATLAIAGPGDHRDPARLTALVAHHAVTTIHFVPSMLQAFLAHEAAASCQGLRRIVCSGEALPAELQARTLQCFPNAALLNLYGPTEAAIEVTYRDCRDEGRATVPIGRPVSRVSAHVLDEALVPAPQGAVGELFLGGLALARGYWDRPALTAERFVADPLDPGGGRLYRTGDLARWRADGQIEYLGRVDHQAKVRGFRVELGEVEAVLQTLPGVREATVVADEGAWGTRLVAYVAGEAALEGRAGQLRQELAHHLPDYMVPSIVMWLDHLPLNVNGKVDRKALPSPAATARPGIVPAEGPVASAIAALWSEVLGTPQVGLDDNFFDLGGHSLLLIRMHKLLEERLQIELPLMDLFQHTSVGALVRHIESGAWHTGPKRPGPAENSAGPRCFGGGPHRKGSADMAPENQPSGSTGVEIAIIGMSGRFPGADSVDALWRNVRDGVESVVAFTDGELRERGLPQALLDDPAYVKSGVPFEGADRFDAGFFGYSPREAEQLDPQQRLFLECAWHAMEDAGCDVQRLAIPVGVYAGGGANLYLMRHLLPRSGTDAGIAELIGLLNGNSADALSTRVAYKLDLRGPAITLQTACSTSLAAVHVACQALLSSECDMALAGGVWLNLLQADGYRHQPGAILSSDGHCRAFDAAADGTVLGSGAGIVVLKRLDDALRDRDTIHAVIKGSAANNDGSAKVGYTAPSVEGQALAIRAALAMADVTADSIGYVEAHGTGTTLGDPIEIAALTQAFRADTQRRGYCAIGSLKTNIGHLDAAAGVAGLIKAVMALRHRVLPPNVNFQAPNPRIDFAASPFHVLTEAAAWPDGPTPRRAGVSSFGMGGTNVHVVLEEAPPAPASPAAVDEVQLRLSARSEAALAAQADALAVHLQDRPGLALGDVAFTLAEGRRRFAHRTVVVARERDAAVGALASRQGPAFISGRVLSETPSVAFLFPGQGTQHPGMARGLYEREPVFRDLVDRCCSKLVPRIGVDLRTLMYPSPTDQDDAARRLSGTAMTQPALFVVEYAMARFWMSRGVQPDALLGHSIGEYAAACVAGVFSLDDALLLVAERGRLLQSTRPGAMLAVQLAEADLLPLLSQGCDLAAVNAPESCVLSGAVEAVEALERELGARGIGVRRLNVSHAFHSALLEPAMAAFEAAWQGVVLHPPSIPFVSNVTGDWIRPEDACSPAYWGRHLRGTVRFADGLRRLMDKADRVLLEVGPGQTLSGLAKRIPGDGGARPVLVSQPASQRDHAGPDPVSEVLARLWVAGLDLPAAPPGAPRFAKVPLPGYPFERQSYWVAPGAVPAASREHADGGQALDDWFHVPVWQRAEDEHPGAPAESDECTLVIGSPSGLARQVHLDLAGAVSGPVAFIEAGDAFARVGPGHHVVRAAARDDFAQALRAIVAEVGVPTRVCHLWSLDVADGERDLPALRTSGLPSLLALAQALDGIGEARRGRALDIVLVTDGAEDVTGEETLMPWKAVLGGARAVLSQELPRTRCRLVDVGRLPSAAADVTRLSARIADEVLRGGDVPVVALRGHHRWLRSFKPARREAPVRQRLRQGGVYVITGGLGGVGRVLAGHLAKAWQAKLVLLGRTPVPPSALWPSLVADATTPEDVRDRLRLLLAWQADGADVMTVQADVADAGQLAAALSSARERFGPIHGVVHAAGVDGRGLLGDKTPEDLASVFHAKVDGAVTLLDALKGQALDFVLLCSSLAAVAGGIGKLDYSAANACLDALAAARRRDGATPVFSVNWDGWRDIGMAAGLRFPEHVGIDAARGAAAFERIVNGPDVPQTIVCTTPLEMRLGGLDEAVAALGRVSDSGSRHARPPHLAATYVAPADGTETTLAGLWSDLLGIAPIGAADNLFEMGGDSLLTIQLVSRIRAVFDVEVTLKQVFEASTVAELARVLEASRPREAGARVLAIVPGESSSMERIPLSHAQQRLWFMWKLDPLGSAFNVAAAFELSGRLELDALRGAFHQLVARHAVLRTVFEEEEDGRAWQVVHAPSPLDVPLVDLEGDDGAVRLAAHLDARARAPFDLSRGPLLRPEVIRLAPGRHVLLLAMHHIVTDGWSIRLMMQDFVRSYAGRVRGGAIELEPLVCQYADFAIAHRRWLEEGEMNRLATHWRNRLLGVNPLVLPADLPEPVKRTHPAGIFRSTVGPALTAEVRAQAQSSGVTAFVALLGGMALALSERSRQKVFYVGSDMANRNRAETESMVGFFVNQVVLPVDCDRPRSMPELLAQLQHTVVEAADHQDLPFDRLAETLPSGRRGSRAPLFQVKVVYQDDVELAFALPDLEVAARAMPLHEAELDLIVSFLAGPDDVRVEIKFDREVHAESTVEDLHEEFLAVLRACVAAADVPLDTLRGELTRLRSARQASRDEQRVRRMAQMRSTLKGRPSPSSASS